jgi:hypothetical protein
MRWLIGAPSSETRAPARRSLPMTSASVRAGSAEKRCAPPSGSATRKAIAARLPRDGRFSAGGVFVSPGSEAENGRVAAGAVYGGGELGGGMGKREGER